MTWPGNSQPKELMLCMYKDSHQTPPVILLLPIDKQCTALLKSTEACQTLELRGWRVIYVLPFIFFLQAPKVGFFFYICCWVFCCCFIFTVGPMQCRFLLVKIWHLSMACNSIFSSSVWLLLLDLKLKLYFRIKTGIFGYIYGVGVS